MNVFKARQDAVNEFNRFIDEKHKGDCTEGFKEYLYNEFFPRLEKEKRAKEMMFSKEEKVEVIKTELTQIHNELTTLVEKRINDCPQRTIALSKIWEAFDLLNEVVK